MKMKSFRAKIETSSSRVDYGLVSAILLASFFYTVGSDWCSYLWGYFRNYYFQPLFFGFMLLGLILFILAGGCFLYRLVFLLKAKKWNLLIMCVAALLFSCFVALATVKVKQPGAMATVKGLQDYFLRKDNYQDIEVIRQWLIKETDSATKTKTLHEDQLIDEIKQFHPAYVFMNRKEEQKSLILEWGGPLEHIGITISIQDDNQFESDVKFSLPIDSHSYVWVR